MFGQQRGRPRRSSAADRRGGRGARANEAGAPEAGQPDADGTGPDGTGPDGAGVGGPDPDGPSPDGDDVDAAGETTAGGVPAWFGPLGHSDAGARSEDPRSGRRRDRHGHGPRGPIAAPGPLTPAGAPVTPTRAQRFDDLVLDAVERLEHRFARQLGGVEFAVEDVPDPDQRHAYGVPLATTLTRPRVQPSDAHPQPDHVAQVARVVIYRRPIELRSPNPTALSALVRDVVVEHVADLLGLAPEDVDADYGDEGLG